MLHSVEAHDDALRDSKSFNLARFDVIRADARDLGSAGIADETIDAVVTSPSVFDRRWITSRTTSTPLKLWAFAHHKPLRDEMTGVRGRGP